MTTGHNLTPMPGRRATSWVSLTLRCGCYFRPSLVVWPDIPVTVGVIKPCDKHGEQQVIRVNTRLFDAPGENNPGQTR